VLGEKSAAKFDRQRTTYFAGWWREHDWLRPAFGEYGVSLGYDQGVIRNDRYNREVHGRVSSNSVELFARGKHVSTSVTFAHSLERPAVMSEREAPIYFRMDFYL